MWFWIPASVGATLMTGLSFWTHSPHGSLWLVALLPMVLGLALRRLAFTGGVWRRLRGEAVCPACGKRRPMPNPGRFRCSDCGAVFAISADRTVRRLPVATYTVEYLD